MAEAKIAFLYSEIAGYFLAGVRELSKKNEVLVVRWPINKEAPFEFPDSENFTQIDKSTLSIDELNKAVHDFKPDVLVCSGWMDKDYLKVAKSFKKQISVVLTLDNHWTGGIKQRVLTTVSPLYLKRIFTHAWVPGEVQATYARKLGFREKVSKNFYCADVDLFQKLFQETFPAKKINLPKRFLYVARYVEHKGIFEMWDAFIELQKENPNEWELWCLGTGDEWENKREHEKIRHFGFVQPEEMRQYIEGTSVYILPSKFEPWGVSVQEFAISGYPMIVSNAVGSREKYVNGNGFVFDAGNKEALKEQMRKFMEMSDKDLGEMGEKSHEVGMSFTNQMWADTVRSFKD
mgnify:CR=1 FL=1